MAVTKIQILLNDMPVVGATVIVGEIGEIEKTTDEYGTAAYPNIVGSYAGFTDVWIDYGASNAVSKAIIRAGQTTVVDLGVIQIE